MCGIFGVIGSSDKFNMKDLLLLLKHRGPDEQEIYQNNQIAFGHTRLSIIAQDEGTQPIVDDEGNVLVFNGEIYNFKELAKKYLNKNYCSDSLVLFDLLKKFQIKILSELRGMFVFAFYQKVTKTTFLARDAFGMKPLFYSKSKNSFYFCSEYLALQKMTSTNLSKSAFYDYLQLSCTVGKETLDSNIKQLLPAEVLIIKEKIIESKSYLSLEDLLELKQKKGFTNEFDKTCKRHLIADVDVGLMLSGGMDSTSIALSLKNSGIKNLDCYSLSFSDVEFDESVQAKKIADYLGYNHIKVSFPQDNFIDYLEEALDKLDGPFGDSSFIPTYFLCKEISKTKKVVLSGDGGDEIFFGYPTFMASRVQDLLPKIVQKLIAYMYEDSKIDSYTRVNFSEKLQRFSWGMDKSGILRHLAYMNSISPKLFNGNFLKTGKKLIDFSQNSNQECFYYFRQYLSQQILIKTDRASMANSLEIRCPFLDVDFVKNTFFYPSKTSLIFQKSKAPIRDYLKNNLPKSLLNFQKKGFSAPLYKILPSLKALVERKHQLNLNCTREKLFQHRFFSYNLLVYLYFYPSDEALKVFHERISLNCE
ncbi:MAG: asparagine synthase (glutamine-hydrolyzing) [Candidatus Cloacimonadota bacterium]|nr:MAG: asparagine synthase (glutamine-hydrolyzing) [Candidatus Cloacimonadota bacterium]